MIDVLHCGFLFEDYRLTPQPQAHASGFRSPPLPLLASSLLGIETTQSRGCRWTQICSGRSHHLHLLSPASESEPAEMGTQEGSGLPGMGDGWRGVSGGFVFSLASPAPLVSWSQLQGPTSPRSQGGRPPAPPLLPLDTPAPPCRWLSEAEGKGTRRPLCSTELTRLTFEVLFEKVADRGWYL